MGFAYRGRQYVLKLLDESADGIDKREQGLGSRGRWNYGHRLDFGGKPQ